MVHERRDQMDDYPKVFTTKSIRVYPRPHPADDSLIRLSNLDRKCSALMYLIFFYRPLSSPPPPHQAGQRQLSAAPATGGPTSPYGSLFSSLKMGLEEVLSDWYPAAGRLCIVPMDSEAKLNLACTNHGAVLVEAETAAWISDLGDLSQHNDFYHHLVFRPPTTVFRPPTTVCFTDTPLVVAQVTKFGCGGYSVGVGTSHALFDGAANYNFLSAWAAKTVGRAAGCYFAPVHERGRLLVTSHDGQGLHQVAVAHGHHRGTEEDEEETRKFMALHHLHQLIKQACTGADGELLRGAAASYSGEQVVQRTFSVSCTMVARLKSKAAATGTTAASCSSFEAVAAHLWKARTKALGIPKHRMVCLQFTVDARARLRPPLPDGFSGNAFVLSSITSSAGELEQQSLADLVPKIKQAKQAVTNSYVTSYIAALDAASPQVALPPLPELTMVSDWTRTPYHKIDFGAGEAAYVAPLATPVPQVACFMQSPVEAGRVDVRIGLPLQHLQAFSHYFLPPI